MGPKDSTRGRLTLTVVSAATALLLLDVTVVTVALPAIRADLDASFAELQWVIDAYALTLAATLLTAGSLADRFGRRRVFILGLAFFSVTSLACALAPVGARLGPRPGRSGTRRGRDLRHLAGAAGGGVQRPGARAGPRDLGSGERRGAGSGPVIGGALVDGLGWEWIFLLNLPLGGGLVAPRPRACASRASRFRGAWTCRASPASAPACS